MSAKQRPSCGRTIVSLRDIASPLQVSVDQSSDCDIGPSSCQRGRVIYWTSETGHKLPLRERLLLCEADIGDLRKPSRQATSRSGRCPRPQSRVCFARKNRYRRINRPVSLEKCHLWTHTPRQQQPLPSVTRRRRAVTFYP
jgi:hypothetical protein